MLTSFPRYTDFPLLWGTLCVHAADQEREEKAVEEALARREAARKVDAAVTSAKSAVWGTVEGVSVSAVGLVLGERGGRARFDV